MPTEENTKDTTIMELKLDILHVIDVMHIGRRHVIGVYVST